MKSKMKTKKLIKKQPKKTVKLTAIEAKRVAILKDALKQHQIVAYIAQSHNGYVDNEDLDDKVADMFNNPNAQVKPLIIASVTPKKPCTICLKGGLFLSAVRKFNSLTFRGVNDGCGLNEIASERARKDFGERNADLMESYFEQGDTSIPSWSDETCPWRELSDDDRFERIVKNAIKHKGMFKPKLEKF